MAETVDLVIPFVPHLVSMIEVKRLYLTQEMIKCLGAELRSLWLIRALRAR
jgi:hypothetical protein